MGRIIWVVEHGNDLLVCTYAATGDWIAAGKCDGCGWETKGRRLLAGVDQVANITLYMEVSLTDELETAGGDGQTGLSLMCDL